MAEKNLPKLSDRELEIMKLLWDHGRLSAGEIAGHFLKTRKQYRNSTYTFISKMLDKGAIRRQDPGFICVPLFERDTLLLHEANTFLDRVYDGSFQNMFAQFVRRKALTEQELADLQRLIDAAKKEGQDDDQSVQ
jgi:predicted transcriptional regulator